MAWPVPRQYGVSTPYGARGHSWSCSENSSGGIHTGDDFACPKGTPVYAPIRGQIRHRNYGSVFGPNQFAISPDPGQPFGDGEVFFAHTLDRLPDGTWVDVGQEIAHVGDLGNATGFHLHAEYMPHTKGAWYCGCHEDPAPVWAHMESAAPPSGGADGPYVTGDVYSNKLGYGEPTNGDADSDSVKELQERLNRISLAGGQTLAVDGRYGPDTDEEVRLWQEQVVHDPPDPPGQSYLGPAQRAAMFTTPPYAVHDTGLPAIASGGGGDSGGNGGTDVPPVDPGPVAPPAPPAVMYPGALWDPIPKDDGTWFTGLRPFVGAARKVTLHTTQTDVKPNWAAQQSGIPHFTIDVASMECWQHLPLDMAAYTMNGGDHSPNSDSGINIQVEVIGYAENASIWTEYNYERLRALLEWLKLNCNVPLATPFFFEPNASVVRRDWETWEAVSGIVGHQHAPYNDHWDPGDLDEDRLVAPPPEPEEPSGWREFLEANAASILIVALGVLLGAVLVIIIVSG